MRYPAFSWERDVTMGLGGIYLYHRLRTDVGCGYFFLSSLLGKKNVVNSDSLCFLYRLRLWILGFLWWSSLALSSVKLYLEGLNGVTPLSSLILKVRLARLRLVQGGLAMPVDMRRESFWIDKSRKMLASYPELCIWYFKFVCSFST